MGPVRQRHLIRLSSVLVALNLAVGLGAVFTHTGAAVRAGVRVTSGAGPASSGGSPAGIGPHAGGGGALAAGSFSRSRRSGPTSSTAASPGPVAGAPTTASSAPAATTGPSGPSPAATGPTGPSPAATGAPPTRRPGPAPATGASTPAPPVPPAGAAHGAGAVTDPAGDTFVDGTQKPITEARADIVAAGAAYGPGGITFTLQVRQPDDPRTDPKWASDATFALWDIDTNGDGKPDFEVQYSYDGKAFAGEVDHPGADDSVSPVCDATTAGYGVAGYSVTIDPACLGNPAAIAFSATIYYDTNPKDDNADVASDVAPNGGMSFPVTRPS